MIACRTLGPVEVLVDGAGAPPALLWKKNLALLIYLARSPKHARTRDHLIGLLWPDKPQAAARQSLREAVRVLRQHAGKGAVEATGDQVRLADGVVELDVDRLSALSARQQWHDAAALIAGEFVEGFAVPSASRFEDWLAAERGAWRRQGIEVLHHEVERCLSRGKAAAACAVAMRSLQLDPFSDTAILDAMRALTLAGDRARALSVYQEFAGRLQQGTGVQPSAEIRTLAQRVRQERVPRSPAYLDEQREHNAESRRAPLVGRETELSHGLETWNGAARDGRAAVVLVLGDPGTGRTRLLDELAARARLDGAVVASTAAVPGDDAQAWSGLFGLASGLIEAPGLAGAMPSALAAFAARLPVWAERFGKTVMSITALPPSAALREVLRNVAEEQPVMLSVDDAQWMDGHSVGALAHALRDLKDLPICVALAFSEPASAPLEELRAHVGREWDGTVIRLERLDEPALRGLVAWAMPQYDEEQRVRLARRLAVDTAGLPLLAVELLHAVALGLDLDQVNGAWPRPLRTLDQTLPGDLPDALVAAIRVGFRRLSAEAQSALAALAVLGDCLGPDAIGRAAHLEAGRLEAALDELEWLRWVRVDARGYSLVARIMRDVIRRDLVTPGQQSRMRQALQEGTGS